jgi:hypothetical protein
MVPQRITLWLALVAGLALALPAAATAEAPSGPVAKAAGGDAVPMNPAIVGVPIQRTQAALDNAAAAIDSGTGADAIGPLMASRRYLIRSYRGARYLIANAPPAPPADDIAAARTFRRMARRAVRASHRKTPARRRSHRADRRWIRVRASGDVAGPTFADTATAVFNVLTSQYSAATAAVGMLPDVQGALLTRVSTTLNTAIILRNRLVKTIAAAAPPAPPEADAARARAHASGPVPVTTFDMVMPGLAVLIADEMQQIQATLDDPTVPAASKAPLQAALTADQQILDLVNATWPPVADD